MIAFIVDVCVKQPGDAAFGLVFVAFGLPLYWVSNAMTQA